MATKAYDTNGVFLSKKTVHNGDTVELMYNGLLAQSGADCIFAHIGYGDSWENKAFIPMDLDQGVFKAKLKIENEKNFNLCFKDSAENWDNNSGENYVFKISAKKAKAETKSEDSDKEEISKKAAKKGTSAKKTAKKAIEM